MMVKVLYISYWGAMEPLGQSLIVPAVIELAHQGAKITLVTFDKPHDLARRDDREQLRERLSTAGIAWRPKKYHKRPKNPATAFDIAHGAMVGAWLAVTGRFDVLHARTYIGGLIGLIVSKLTGIKFIYHNEGFYPDEQVDGGVWAAGSRIHRIAKYLENLMYARADGIIALSHRARTEIENLPAVAKKKTPVIMVPSCVDLDHFNAATKRRSERNGPIKLVYIGSVGDRYILDDIGRFVYAINRDGPRASFHIYSQADPQTVKRMLAKSGLTENDWTLTAARYSEMPGLLANYDVGLFFLKRGTSEHGCSPTKIGEYWATGLATISTPNVSDTDALIEKFRVGAVVEKHDAESYIEAFRQIEDLLKDPDLHSRCRAAAVEHYSLRPACKRQMDLYVRVLDNKN